MWATTYQKVKGGRQTLTTCAPYAPSATRLWETTTLSTSSLLYRGQNTPGTSGSALGWHLHLRRRDQALGLDQVAHLLLGLRLVKHENEHDEGEGAELTELRVIVPVHSVERERNLLDETARQVHQRADDGELENEPKNDAPLGVLLVQ